MAKISSTSNDNKLHDHTSSIIIYDSEIQVLKNIQNYPRGNTHIRFIYPDNISKLGIFNKYIEILYIKLCQEFNSNIILKKYFKKDTEKKMINKPTLDNIIFDKDFWINYHEQNKGCSLSLNGLILTVHQLDAFRHDSETKKVYLKKLSKLTSKFRNKIPKFPLNLYKQILNVKNEKLAYKITNIIFQKVNIPWKNNTLETEISNSSEFTHLRYIYYSIGSPYKMLVKNKINRLIWYYQGDKDTNLDIRWSGIVNCLNIN